MSFLRSFPGRVRGENAQNLLDRREDSVHVPVADYVRRQEVDDVAEGSQQKVTFEELFDVMAELGYRKA